MTVTFSSDYSLAAKGFEARFKSGATGKNVLEFYHAPAAKFHQIIEIWLHNITVEL